MIGKQSCREKVGGLELEMAFSLKRRVVNAKTKPRKKRHWMFCPLSIFVYIDKSFLTRFFVKVFLWL
jgi:hypothetical protein